MSDSSDLHKLPGKTVYSGRRRPTTRKSGYKSHPESTGGEFKILAIPTYGLKAGQQLSVLFQLPEHLEGEFVGFGGWFSSPPEAQVSCDFTKARLTLSYPPQPDWGKVGSMWISTGEPVQVIFTIKVTQPCNIALWEMGCGVIVHDYLVDARKALLRNMYQFSPEAHFFNKRGTVAVSIDGGPAKLTENTQQLYLKSCNRCARFLPINVIDERTHLSFTNHCTAPHRVPCSHSGFGKLTNIDDGTVLQLRHGFQLECRFCKKFEVNAAHNPQRTTAQMKEDGTRRRAIELLLMGLYGGSPQLLYRHKFGSELAEDVWNRFGRQCFNCGTPLKTARHMALDHTRPLALLWQLDETATALCKHCNGEKRDRPPVEFYSQPELERLSRITGIPMEELLSQ